MLLIINTSNYPGDCEIGPPRALSFMLSFEICRATESSSRKWLKWTEDPGTLSI